MKNLILLLFVSLIGISCSDDNDRPAYHYEILAIDSFEAPAFFNLGEVHTITLFYKRPNDCHTDQSLYFEKKDSTRTVAIQSLVFDSNNCQEFPNEDPIKGTFQFEALSTSTYLFRFYKGKDENGANIFEEVSIPVIN